MLKKFAKRNHDIIKYRDRLEVTSVLGTSIGALSFGAAGVAAFTEVVADQTERLVVAGSLAGIAITGLALATNASMKIPILQSMIKSSEQSETHLYLVKQEQAGE